MAKRSFIVASLLVASVAAVPQNIPASCTRVSTLVQSCVPSDATSADLSGTEVASCLCADSTFDDDIVTCIKDAGSVLPADAQSALEAFDGYCALYGGGSGGGSGGNTRSATVPEPTSEPTSSPTSGGSGSGGAGAACSYIIDGINTCWTDQNALPTAAPVARCLCSGTDFDLAVEGCYSALVDANPDEASTIGLLAGLCSSFSNGDFGSATATDDSGPATTGFLDPGSTSIEDSPSSTRAIQTLNGGSSSSTGGSSPASTSSGSGGTTPNSASGFKVAFVGTTIAAFFAGVAMLL